ncbi:MAG: hypothetical protein WBF33_33870, partial [Candidatus Nitrosopolaris sp.]
KLLEEVNNYSERYHETATGLETWFDLPDLKTQISVTPPPRWNLKCHHLKANLLHEIDDGMKLVLQIRLSS